MHSPEWQNLLHPLVEDGKNLHRPRGGSGAESPTVHFKIDRTYITNADRMYERRLDPVQHSGDAASSREAALAFVQTESAELLSVDVQADGTCLATAASATGIFVIQVRSAP